MGGRVMRVSVELFGIPRQRAGVSTVEVELAGASATVDEILQRLAARFPSLSTDCVDVRDDRCEVRHTACSRCATRSHATRGWKSAMANELCCCRPTPADERKIAIHESAACTRRVDGSRVVRRHTGVPQRVSRPWT